MQQVNLCNFNAEACQTALHFFYLRLLYGILVLQKYISFEHNFKTATQFHYSVFFVVAINLEQTKTSQDATQAEIKYQKLLHGLRTADSAVKAYISGMYYKQDVC